MTSVKQFEELFNFRCKIQLEHPVQFPFSDERCSGEDRLLQCELNGRQVQKSIPDDITVFDNMFYKSWMSARVSNTVE